MAFLDFLRRKELCEIRTLNEQISELAADLDTAKSEINSLSKFKNISDLDKERQKLLSEMSDIQCEINNLHKQINELTITIEEKKAEIIELDDTILLQDFGMYSPIYDFANSELYKERLDKIRQIQKEMIKDGTAAVCDTMWTVDGSITKGRAMANQNVKQIIRCFNDECDLLISKVKFNNIVVYKERIKKSYEALNKMNSKNTVHLTVKYLTAKIDELNLAYEYALKKQQEKEEQKRIREQLREEAKLQKEIEEARKDISKEQKHYENALQKLLQQINVCDSTETEYLLERKSQIENHLAELNASLKDIDYREANKRAGYVYVISNIGSFGENVYKIGMTRRLDPMERVDELGDASVPFCFDVHAMIFSEDAPTLEAALHRAFENKKVNMINGRREFFAVTLSEIEEVVKANFDKTVDFIQMPEANQYRESLKIRKALGS